jgi:hypothetical protein
MVSEMQKDDTWPSSHSYHPRILPSLSDSRAQALHHRKGKNAAIPTMHLSCSLFPLPTSAHSAWGEAKVAFFFFCLQKTKKKKKKEIIPQIAKS